MSRNGSGTYTLPASGNPVVGGTTISSTWANATLNDIATTLTASLDRSGNGGMLAQFKAFAGTSGAPGISWADELDSGLYRASSKHFGMQVHAITAQIWTDTLVTIPLDANFGADVEITGTLTCDQDVDVSATLTADVLRATSGLLSDGPASAVGNVAFPGLLLTGSAARPPLQLTPQAVPSALANGDFWVESGTNTLKVRINGVTKTVTLT